MFAEKRKNPEIHIVDKKSTNLKNNLFFVLSIVFFTYALDDLPLYLDAGCDSAYIPKSFAQGPVDMKLPTIDNKSFVPITCTEALTGSDAAVIKLDRKLIGGEFYDFEFKWADDQSHSIKGYKDLRLWVKNKNNTVAKFRLYWVNANYSFATAKTMEIAAGTNWQEIVIPLTELGSDSVASLKFSHPLGQYNGPDVNADPIHILIDSITVTDGTNNNSLVFPERVINSRPSKWTSTFLVGSFDNRNVNKSSKEAQAGCPYRYQYIMPDVKPENSPYGNDYPYNYAMESKALNVKTAIVWYNLGKSAEGFDPISANLKNVTYMGDYFTRYDWVLDQLARAGQSDYMIIFEPDMYGFLMRGKKFHPTDVPVDMTKANSLSGKTYESNLVGWAKYLVERAHEKLPNGVITGHMPNHWGVNIPGQVGQGRKEAHIMSGLTIGQFIKELGPVGMGDIVFVEKTDHDAGNKPTDQNWFWDSTGYANYFLWTRTIAYRTGLPIVGWQVSEGNMSNSKKSNQDNAVETFLAHPQWWVDGGFIGILFGAGNPGNSNYIEDNDGGWFVQNIKQYNTNPYMLPTSGVLPFATNSTKRSSIMVKTIPAGILLCGWSGIADIELFSLSGKQICKERTFNSTILPASQLQSGMYLYSVGSAMESVSGSFMVK